MTNKARKGVQQKKEKDNKKKFKEIISERINKIITMFTFNHMISDMKKYEYERRKKIYNNENLVFYALLTLEIIFAIIIIVFINNKNMMFFITIISGLITAMLERNEWKIYRKSTDDMTLMLIIFAVFLAELSTVFVYKFKPLYKLLYKGSSKISVFTFGIYMSSITIRQKCKLNDIKRKYIDNIHIDEKE